MIFKLVSAGLVLAIASASNSTNSTDIEGFPTEGWGITEWALGVFAGAYGPLNERARNEDCYSAWYTWGVASVEFSAFWDKWFDIHAPYDYLEMVVKVGQFAYETFRVWDICIKEYNYNAANPTSHLLADDVKIPLVGAMSSTEIKWTIRMVFEWLLGGMYIAHYWLTDFYFWGLGMQMGKLASNLFVAIDYWAKTGVITPMSAKIRYADVDGDGDDDDDN